MAMWGSGTTLTTAGASVASSLVVTPSVLGPLFTNVASCNQNTNGLRQVEEQLKTLEIQPGFHRSLLALVADRALDVGIRLQAVLYLKNGIDRYWRRIAPNAIREEEKQEIRDGLLQVYVEPVYPIALQIAVIVAKIARLDLPKDWQGLIHHLENGVLIQEPSVQHRSLLLLYHTVKVMASKRLSADRRVFHELAEHLLPFLLPLWRNHHGVIVDEKTEDSSLSPCLEVAILLLKILRCLVMRGLRKPHEHADTRPFFVDLLNHARRVLILRKEKPELHTFIEKYAVLHMKLFSDLLEIHPYSFVTVLPDCLQFICKLCFIPEEMPLLFQRFAILSLNVIKQVILCPEYKVSKHNKDDANSELKSAENVKKTIFTAPVVADICQRLLRVYLPLRQDDLLLWDSDPEQYACEDGGDAWRYNYRPCTESLFLSLFHEHRQVLSELLISELKEISEPCSPNDIDAILRKDAVYNAVGLVAFELFDDIDFDAFLTNVVPRELATGDANYRIIRRRMVWLIGQWSGVKVSPENRPLIYQLLLPALRAEEDLVVRLSAAKSLKIVVDDFEFCAEEVRPHLQLIFERLFCLLREVEECDTKLTVLNVLSYLIERVSVGIRDICQGLVHYLPHLWEASVDHNMLRCSILTTLIVIVQCLGTASQNISPFIFSVVKLSTNLDDERSVYLLEDGLELWLAALHNSKNLTNEWKSLVFSIPRIMELPDCLRTTLFIAQAYTLLAPVEFLRTCGEPINRVLDDQYADLQQEAVLMILRLLDVMLKVGPPETPLLFKSLIQRSFLSVYEGTDYPHLLSHHLSVISRIVVSFPESWKQFVTGLGQGIDVAEDAVVGRILDVWLDSMPLVTQMEKKKLLSMALISTLLLGMATAQQRVFSILQNVGEALNDVMRPEENSYIDSLLMTGTMPPDNNDAEDFSTEHDERKRIHNFNDVIHKVNFSDFVQERVSSWGQFVGEATYTDTISNLDIETKNMLKEYISF